MNKEKIEILREKINCMVDSEGVSKSELVSISQQMDDLIVEYIKGQMEAKKSE